MMPIEKQVVSLELSKQIKKLGCKQESLFYWSELQYGNFNNHIAIVNEPFEDWYGDISSKLCISAFTVGELINMVEQYSNEWAVGYDDSGCFYRFVRGERGCGSMMQGFGGKSNFNSSGDEETFVDAFAQWVIYLLENGLTGKERGRENE